MKTDLNSRPSFRLLLGDAEVWFRDNTVKPGSVDWIFTSPPPCRTQDDIWKILKIFDGCKRVLKPTGSMFVHMGDFHDEEGSLEMVPQAFMLEMRQRHGWLLRGLRIWHRPVRIGTWARKEKEDRNRFFRDWDFIMWYTQSRYGYFFDTELITVAITSIDKCPYVYPEFPHDIIATLMSISCPEGGTVLDPFMGDGGTGLVALELGRNFIGIDSDWETVKKAELRLRKIK